MNITIRVDLRSSYIDQEKYEKFADVINCNRGAMDSLPNFFWEIDRAMGTTGDWCADFTDLTEEEEKSMVKELKDYGFKHIIKITKEAL